MFFWISGQPRKHKFDAWTVGLISFFAIGSTILITDAFKPLNPSLKTKEAEIAATCPLLDLTDNSEICVLNKGEKVEVLAYTTSYFQVQTEKGERGWVYMTAFGNEMVVEELDNKAGLETRRNYYARCSVLGESCISVHHPPTTWLRGKLF